MINRDYFTQITSSLYNLTLLFPKKDPLRYKMRGLADDILAGLISLPHTDPKESKNTISKIRKDLDVLDSFFGIVKSQNWVSSSNILEIQGEYSKIRKATEGFEELKKTVPATEKISPLNERQQKILEILREKKRVQIGELAEVFPQLSKRTLIRDLEELMYRALVKREGSGRGVVYNIVS